MTLGVSDNAGQMAGGITAVGMIRLSGRLRRIYIIWCPAWER
jgi:hypothetical protein